MKTKQEILERSNELEVESFHVARKAYEDALRHHKAKQGKERLELQAECNATGGHLFSGQYCDICGADKDARAKQIVHNLTVTG